MSETKLISKILDAYHCGESDKRNGNPYNNVYKRGKGREAYQNGYYSSLAIARLNKLIK